MDPQFCQSLMRPAGSRDATQCRPGGVTLIVPPTGVWRGAGMHFVWGVLWSGMSLFYLAALLAAACTPGDFPVRWDFWAALFWGACLMPGVWVVCWAFDQGRRYGVLSVQGDLLTVRTVGPFGVWSRRWCREEVADVRPGPSRMQVNGDPVLELQVHLKRGGKVGLLMWRSPDDLDRLADALRRALDLPEGEVGAAVRPPACGICLSPSGGSPPGVLPGEALRAVNRPGD